MAGDLHPDYSPGRVPIGGSGVDVHPFPRGRLCDGILVTWSAGIRGSVHILYRDAGRAQPSMGGFCDRIP